MLPAESTSLAAPSRLSATVIIVTADRPHEVRRCLAAFFHQLPTDCDALVVDASRDAATEKVVGEFPGARYLRSPVRNRCVQRNLGIQASEKAVVAYMDDDCIAQPDWLGELLRGYTAPDLTSVVGAIREADLQEFAPDQAPIVTAFGPIQPITNWRCSAPCEVLNGQGGNMSFRRAALLVIGGFDANYLVSSNGEEPDVFIRLRRNGGRIWYTPASVVQHCPAQTHGFQRSSFDKRFMFWVGYNHAYGNTKLFLGRREFFWYFGWDSLRFCARQLGRLTRAVASHCLVTLAHLAGKFCGLIAGLRWRLTR